MVLASSDAIMFSLTLPGDMENVLISCHSGCAEQVI